MDEERKPEKKPEEEPEEPAGEIPEEEFSLESGPSGAFIPDEEPGEGSAGEETVPLETGEETAAARAPAGDGIVPLEAGDEIVPVEPGDELVRIEETGDEIELAGERDQLEVLDQKRRGPATRWRAKSAPELSRRTDVSRPEGAPIAEEEVDLGDFGALDQADREAIVIDKREAELAKAVAAPRIVTRKVSKLAVACLILGGAAVAGPIVMQIIREPLCMAAGLPAIFTGAFAADLIRKNEDILSGRIQAYIGMSLGLAFSLICFLLALWFHALCYF